MIPDYLKRSPILSEKSFQDFVKDVSKGYMSKWIISHDGRFKSVSPLERIWERIKCLFGFNRTSREAVAFEVVHLLGFGIEKKWIKKKEIDDIRQNLTYFLKTSKVNKKIIETIQKTLTKVEVQLNTLTDQNEQIKDKKIAICECLNVLLPDLLPFWIRQKQIDTITAAWIRQITEDFKTHGPTSEEQNPPPIATKLTNLPEDALNSKRDIETQLAPLQDVNHKLEILPLSEHRKGSTSETPPPPENSKVEQIKTQPDPKSGLQDLQAPQTESNPEPLPSISTEFPAQTPPLIVSKNPQTAYVQFETFINSKPNKDALITHLPSFINVFQSTKLEKVRAINLLIKSFIDNPIDLYCIGAMNLGSKRASSICSLYGWNHTPDPLVGKKNIENLVPDPIERGKLFVAAARCAILGREDEKKRQMEDQGPNYDLTEYDSTTLDLLMEATKSGYDMKPHADFFEKHQVWYLLAARVYERLSKVKTDQDMINTSKSVDFFLVICADYEESNLTKNNKSIVEATAFLQYMWAAILSNFSNPKFNEIIKKVKKESREKLTQLDRWQLERYMKASTASKFSAGVQLTHNKNIPEQSTLTSEGFLTPEGEAAYIAAYQKVMNSLINDKIVLPEETALTEVPISILATGICFGMGKSFVEKTVQLDIRAEDFEEQLIQGAKKFESGGDADAVAYQIAHYLFPNTLKNARDVLTASLITDLSPDDYKTLILHLDQNIPNEMRDQGWIDTVDSVISKKEREQPLSEMSPRIKELHSAIIQEWKSKPTPFALEKHIVNIQMGVHAIKIMEDPAKPKQIDTIQQIFQKNVLREKIVRIGNHVYKKLNLKMKPLLFKTGLTTDDKITSIWMSEEDGFYDINLKTTPGHNVILIKKKQQLYLFDPNFGLLKFDKTNPVKTMNEVLSQYKPHYDVENMNQITISKIDSA